MSDVVTLNKQSDETNRSSSENVLENVNQRTNTAEITSQTTESDEQNGDTVEQEEEQTVSIVQLRKSKRSVSDVDAALFSFSSNFDLSMIF
jgi:hypothetical protein